MSTSKAAPVARPNKSAKKRKAPTVQDDEPSTAVATEQQQRPTKKPKQKKNRPADANDEDALLDLDAGINTIFTRMDSDLLADHVAAKTKRFGADLSTVELSDLYVPAGAIRDTTSFAEPRVKENLAAFLEAFAGSEEDKKRLGSAPKEVGAPHTVVVAGAGLRAADLVR